MVSNLPTNTQPMTVIGLMSGTSVDAVDACAAKLWMDQGTFRHEVIGSHTQAMPAELKTRLLSVMGGKTTTEEICKLNAEVGKLFGETAKALMEKLKTKIDLIGSHGQTIFHSPPTKPGEIGSTLQIGEPAYISQLTGVPVVADFRPADMAAGGQGAPLVCFADALIFGDDTSGRCVQNIGGIANVTVLPEKGNVFAFDTGPGNMLIDAAMNHFYNKPYDENGAIAASGKVDEPFLKTLEAHPYFEKKPPKTTGRELFGVAYLKELLGQLKAVKPEDVVATLTHHTAKTIANAYEKFVFPVSNISEMIVGGGGAKNKHLLKLLQEFLPKIKIKTHDDYGIDNQYKEALAFAILAWATKLGIPSNIPSCTGATKPVILGKTTNF